MHFDLYKDKSRVLEQIEQNRVYTIAVTNLPKIFNDYQNQFNWTKFKYVRLALGFHPELVNKYYRQIDKFVELLPNAQYVGEVGLDYATNNATFKDAQKEVFQQIILECSKYKNKILTIHSRNAEKDILQLMKNFSGVSIFHWYSGSINGLLEAVERGYYFSVNQQMLLSKGGREIVNSIPIKRILIESDAPFTKGLEHQYHYFFMNEIYKYFENTRKLDENELSIIFKNNFKEALNKAL